VADRRNRLTDRLRPRLDRLGRSIGRQLAPAARLARLDTGVLRAWISRVGPVRDTLGAAEGMGYTRMVVAAAEKNPEIARTIAYTLPDHMARVESAERARYLSLLRVVMKDRIEALPLVIKTLPDLLGRMDDASLARYLSQGIALHDRSSRKAESFFKLESGEGVALASALRKGVELSGVRRRLTLYARAHCGEDVQIRPGGQRSFTDGRHIYLPESIERLGEELDLLTYRVLTARNVGYLEFGTLDLDLHILPGTWPAAQEGELELERMLRGFDNPVLARDIFSILENARVESRVRTEYPGIARDMDRLGAAWREERPALDGLSPVEQAVEWLARVALGQEPPPLADDKARAAAESVVGVLTGITAEDATVNQSAAALVEAYGPLDALMRRVDDDDLNPAQPNEGEPASGDSPQTTHDDHTPQEMRPETDKGAPGSEGEGPDLMDYRGTPQDPLSGAMDFDQLSEGDRSTEDRARELLEAMRQTDPTAGLEEARRQARAEGSSYEEMAEFLDRMEGPSGPATEHSTSEDISERGPATGGPLADGDPTRSFLYPEWDAEIEDHKPRWVRLTEYILPAGDPEFVERVRQEHGPLIGRIRRSFEALRPEAVRRVRGEADGDEIDLDLAIAARLERRCGGSPSDRIYTRRLRQDRDVAVAFLLDMSSSTNEIANIDGKRILDVEKEALVLINEAVDAIGDASAIYGFSGYGRDSVAFYVAKDFTDRWDAQIAERIGRISWKMENRDGAAIRHATRKLAEQPARVKLLLLLSDGKPLDCGCDHYSDYYAQEDTRAALTEARSMGIHPFCITVDPHGQDYLARMYGEHGYTVIDRVESLPDRLPRIYRRLTR
jgi:nitric oxide reductase NorD protein